MRPSEVRILIIDLQRELHTSIEAPLKKRGYQVTTVRSAQAAIDAAHQDPPNLVIKPFVSERQEKQAGVMEEIRSASPDSQFIFVSPAANVQMAMQAIHRGAFDCLPLPCENSQLLDSVQRALKHQLLVAENEVIRKRLHPAERPNFLAGESPALKRIQHVIDRIADTNVTILIEGESGTGKELVARTLHEQSSRHKGPFVAVNCAALADSIIESELFGHVRGAFTGAITDKPGRFELARGGTLFLDEIGDLSSLGQADLLRVVEDGIFRPLGSRNTSRADVRIVAATNRRLEDRCRQGLFREDLLYRLNVITISIPPLRDRPEDISVLAASFLSHFCGKHKRPLKKLSTALERELVSFSWPGNVRQLRNLIEHMVLISTTRTLEPDDLPFSLSPAPKDLTDPWQDMTLAEVEQKVIARTLESCGNNRSEAARRLGISRRSLHYRIKAGNTSRRM